MSSLVAVVAGAGVFCAVVLIERISGGLPLAARELLIPAILGAGTGLLCRHAFGPAASARRSREHDERLRSLYRNTPALLHSLDADGCLVDVSQNWLETMGYRRETVLGRPFSEFIVADNPAEVQRRHRCSPC